MNDREPGKLPLNPYQMQPLKNEIRLPGRKEETGKISYYLDLTAAGQSPHIALIGERGVGKTSLLNAAELICREKRLLPVRIDLDQGKTRSCGVFWHGFYVSLLNAAAKQGCWGGRQGSIYSTLYKMLFAGEVDSIENAVLQFPYALAYQSGNLDGLICSDALIEGDLEAAVIELRKQEPQIHGIAFLIDEANCLKDNLPLLQMFRNVFQRVDHCSLVFAGTDDVFPAISDVFSPIPRQFIRLNVGRFAHWTSTAELVRTPLDESSSQVIPNIETMTELHELCGGDPTELQMYCHEMYRLVEQGACDKMTLHPLVFKRVSEAYRSHTDQSLLSVLRAVEALPDDLLFGSDWLRFKRLTIEENIDLHLMLKALELGRRLAEEEADDVSRAIRDSYSRLAESGVTAEENKLSLVGDPLTSGFWKSYVEAEKSHRWSWCHDEHALAIWFSVAVSLGASCKSSSMSVLSLEKDQASPLEVLRQGMVPSDVDPHFVYELASRVPGYRDKGSSYGYDIVLNLSYANQSRLLYIHGNPELSPEGSRRLLEEFLTQRSDVLADHGIAADVTRMDVWDLPSDYEFYRLARLAEVPSAGFREAFGPDLFQQAMDLFDEGDVEGTCDIYKNMLSDRNDVSNRNDCTVANNLAYCLILTNEFAQARQCFENRALSDLMPLDMHNYGIATLLDGNRQAGVEALRRAREKVASEDAEYDGSAICMLIINPDCTGATSVDDLPIMAACALNLHAVGEMTREELEAYLRSTYHDRCESLLRCG